MNKPVSDVFVAALSCFATTLRRVRHLVTLAWVPVFILFGGTASATPITVYYTGTVQSVAAYATTAPSWAKVGASVYGNFSYDPTAASPIVDNANSVIYTWAADALSANLQINGQRIGNFATTSAWISSNWPIPDHPEIYSDGFNVSATSTEGLGVVDLFAQRNIVGGPILMADAVVSSTSLPVVTSGVRLANANGLGGAYTIASDSAPTLYVGWDLDTSTFKIAPGLPPPIPVEAMSSRSGLPLGTLKIWTGKAYVPLASAEGQSYFDNTKDTEVLIHGWNGVGANNTPLEDKWIAGFTSDLRTNHGTRKNILAFDWTEAANSREFAVRNMVAAELGVSLLELSQLESARTLSLGFSSLAETLLKGIGRSDLAVIYDFYVATDSLWNRKLNDKWVPNEQVGPQGSALASQLQTLLSSPGSGNVSFFGHSLGAGVATKAVEVLLDKSLGSKVSRLTFFDAPEDIAAKATSGTLLLEGQLASIRSKSPNLAIDNYWSAFGKSYPDAANIYSDTYGHSDIANSLYADTIRYNKSPEKYLYSSDIPMGIGYDDSKGNLVRLRTGTNCITGWSGFSPFGGLDTCKSSGFSPVKRSEYTTSRVFLDFDAYLTSPDARVEIDPSTGLPTLITGSPVFAFADDLFITKEMTGIEIDFEWLARYESDIFRFWINDTLVFSLDASLAGDGLISTGLIGLDRWSGEWVRLTFGVISDFAGSALAIRDIRLVEVTTLSEPQPVPEPSSFVLVALGLLLLANRLRGARSSDIRG